MTESAKNTLRTKELIKGVLKPEKDLPDHFLDHAGGPLKIYYKFGDSGDFSSNEIREVQKTFHGLEKYLNVKFEYNKIVNETSIIFHKSDLLSPGSQISGFSTYKLSNYEVIYQGIALFHKDYDVSKSENRTSFLQHIGQALSLKKASKWSHEDGMSYGPIDRQHDNQMYTIMSDIPRIGSQNTDLFFGVVDIAALQARWGVNKTTNVSDTIYSSFPTKGSTPETIWDAGGIDTIDASATKGDFDLDLRPGQLSTVGAFKNVVIAFGTIIENAKGGSGSDYLFGNNSDNKLEGGGGWDTIRGFGGNDTLKGGEGNDHIYGGTGDDLLFGGNGDDNLEGNEGADTIYGGNGKDSIFGGDGNDFLKGGDGEDQIFGGHGDDKLNGGAGDDTLFGLDGDDSLYGGGGVDSLFGGVGNDRLIGGSGGDLFYGGKGGDKFICKPDEAHGNDFIKDYNAEEGDLLVFTKNLGADSKDFNVHDHFEVKLKPYTPGGGEEKGNAYSAEILYKETGHTIWLVDDFHKNEELNISLDGHIYDLFGG